MELQPYRSPGSARPQRPLRLACLALPAAVLSVAAQAEVTPATMLRLAPHVLKLEANTRSGQFAMGSAVLVGRDLVATNCHVTRDAVVVRLLHGGLRYTAVAQASDVRRDLCVLRVPGIESEPAELAGAAELRQGDPLLAIGHNFGQGIQFSEGKVVALNRLDGGQVIRSSNWFTSGASGGGLFDAQGRLAGILTFRLRGGPAHYYSIPAEWIAALAADPTRFRPVAPLEGRTFWEQDADQQAPFLRAMALGISRQWQSLAGFARQWAANDPDDAAAPLALAEALEEVGELAGAEAAAARVVALAPGDAEGWWRRGRLLARLGRDADARTALAHLQSLDVGLARQLAQVLEK